jgi:t-SNARE complex subunit (syntaxin)|tara:strand:+ start:189 stop:689 length:501 start_codon:yes stop_codon:yes gene_type:complete
MYTNQNDKQQHSAASLGLRKLTKEYKITIDTKVKESIKADVVQIRAKTKPVCLAAKDALKIQKEKLKTAKDAELRMREQSFSVTAKSFIDSVKNYQNAHVAYEDEVRSAMRRHLENVTGLNTYSEEEKDKIIDEGRAQQVCNAVMLKGSGAAANAYKDVSEQHKVC